MAQPIDGNRMLNLQQSMIVYSPKSSEVYYFPILRIHAMLITTSQLSLRVCKDYQI